MVAMVEKNKTKKCGGVLYPVLLLLLLHILPQVGVERESYGIYVRVNKMIVLVIRIGSTQVIKST